MTKTLGLQLAAAAGLLLLWQGVVWLAIWPPFLFPGPVEVAATMGRIALSGELATAVWVTFRRIAMGFLLAGGAGLLLGAALARFQRLAAVLSPMVMGLQAMPSICWFPLAILWFGLNESAILFVTIIGALFAVATTTEAAFRTIPPQYLRAAATMGAKGWRLYWQVMLPAALPTLLTGLRTGWSFAWRSLMAAELLFMSLGLGHLLGVGRELVDAALVVAVILVVLLFGLAVDRLLFARTEAAVRQRWGFGK